MTLLQTAYESLRLQPTGFSFIFLLLPAFLFAYYAAPAKARPAVLLGISLAYSLAAEPRSFLLLLACIGGNYLIFRLLLRFDAVSAAKNKEAGGESATSETARRICLWVAVTGNVLVIIICGIFTQTWAQPQIFGLHIYTLSALCAILSAYMREGVFEGGFVRYAAYCSFFPRLYGGPLSSYGDFADQVGKAKLNVLRVLEGLGHFLEGAFKTAVIGGNLYALYSQIRGLGADHVTALSSWCTVFCMAFALYFLLSGYGDMAQGLGKAFGIALPRNFYYPYQSRNMEDFFDRFNITIHSFLRKTVYTGLGGTKNGPLADALNMLVVGMLSGLWFGLRVNYIAWGAFLALFVILERYVYPGLLEHTPTLFCRIGTLCAVLASFTIFVGGSIPESVSLVRSMFHFGNLFNDQILYLISSNWLLLLLSCFFATNATSLVVTKLRRRAPGVAAVLVGAADFVILVLLLALTY